MFSKFTAMFATDLSGRTIIVNSSRSVSQERGSSGDAGDHEDKKSKDKEGLELGHG